VTPLGATALANNPGVRTIIPYDKRGTYGSAQGLWQTIKEIRGRRPYDAAYLALAESRGTTVLTADLKLFDRATTAGLGHLVTRLTSA